ncbi:hypothetical protein CKAN_01067600 [Cinnamomum micranthum f. kanehirae]|uniref:Uncharacterized protein n=1 Tax=Cinnamomum micranthum f. kanehirae TaxID=337451 RepID=A0A3S3P3A6_9MAGN|nr:hypothetical protein CKAN_01067600 [Cinnamomum micranthum f. kanehirae]
MSCYDCVEALARHARIHPLVTLTVWRELLKENRGFFQAYYQAFLPRPITCDVNCLSVILIFRDLDANQQFIQESVSIKVRARYLESTWQPAMISEMNTFDYWVNWRFLMCAIVVLFPMIVASILIRKYEGSDATKHDNGETLQETTGALYEDECWRPCLKGIHPAWLLGFRILAFSMLLALLIIKVVIHRGSIYFYYTQWTFLLVTIYFGLGCLLSIYGCHQFISSNGDKAIATSDSERGTYVAPTLEKNANPHRRMKSSVHREEHYVHQIAGIWGYAFQIIYQINKLKPALFCYHPQTCAGAAMLTDVVFWLIIFPFLTHKDYTLNFLLVGMHSVNVVFLLGDTALNCLWFPWFRISYFVLWTAMFVIFQWIIHAFVSLRWPYPFLDLSSPYAAVWYLSVALLQIPCYAIFALVIRLKCYLLSRWFPQSYQCLK